MFDNMAHTLVLKYQNTNMRKSILPLLLFLAFSLGAAAQGSFKIGARVGSTMYKIDGQSFQSGFKFGYHLGGAMEIMFNKKFGIQPEVLFNKSTTQTGDNLNDLLAGLNLSAATNLNYLSIPLLVNIRPSGGPLTLQLGPQFGILMNSTQTLVQNGTEAFKKGDFSMMGGVQIHLSAFRIYGRYGIGLSNLNDIASSQEWRSQMIQLGLGLNF
jgi:hypothetical protein